MKFDWKSLILPSVHLAQMALNGAGQGNARLAMVSNIIQTALLVAAASGAVPASAATDLQAIHNQVNEVVADQNAKGVLDKLNPSVPAIKK